MKTRPFIPQKDERMPDFYTMTVHYVDGKKEEFKLAGHQVTQFEMLDFVTTDDIVQWIPLTSVKRIEFDKNFSTMMALKREYEMNQARESAKK